MQSLRLLPIHQFNIDEESSTTSNDDNIIISSNKRRKYNHYNKMNYNNIYKILFEKSIGNIINYNKNVKEWSEQCLMETNIRNNNINQILNHDYYERVSTSLICVSPNNKEFTTSHGNHTLRVYEIKRYEIILKHILRGHPRTCWRLAYHPNSLQNLLVSVCLSGNVRVWHTSVGRLVATLYMKDIISSELIANDNFVFVDQIVFCPNNSHIILIASYNSIYAWHYTRRNLRHGKPVINRILTTVSKLSNITYLPNSINESRFVLVVKHDSSLSPAKCTIMCLSTCDVKLLTRKETINNHDVNNDQKLNNERKKRFKEAVNLLQPKNQHIFHKDDHDFNRVVISDRSEDFFDLVWQLSFSKCVNFITFSKSGRYLAYIVGTNKKSLCICDIESQSKILTKPNIIMRKNNLEDINHVSSLTFSNTDKYLIITYVIDDSRFPYGPLPSFPDESIFPLTSTLNGGNNNNNNENLLLFQPLSTNSMRDKDYKDEGFNDRIRERGEGLLLRSIIQCCNGEIVSTHRVQDATDEYNSVATFDDPSYGILYGTRQGRIIIESMSRIVI